ncbi:MAG: NFACT RNA binding domain-containing protein [Deltaproteobacteria bacterium]|nr:NFACT RNA binding domain-containing protein [Deltaproteobacteria bacterium]
MPGMRLEPLPPRQGAWKEEHIEKKEGQTWNKAADLHYCGLLSLEEASDEKGLIKSAIKKAGDKAKRLIENLNSDKEKARINLKGSKLGELILSNMPAIKKGVKEALLVDYSALPPAKVLVELDQRLSPYGNAERYFKKAKKAKTALNMLGSRITEAEAELEYLNELEYGLEEAATKQELDELRSELVEGGYVKAAPMEGAKAVKTRPNEPVRKARTSEGFTLLCGKSAKGNDLIVKKYAKDKDIGLHASGVPGSHVLIKTAGKEQGLTEKTIIEAAAFAAWHSKSRGELKAEVIYTEAKNVFKPKGAHPGMVLVKEYKSIMAAPMDITAIENDD